MHSLVIDKKSLFQLQVLLCRSAPPRSQEPIQHPQNLRFGKGPSPLATLKANVAQVPARLVL